MVVQKNVIPGVDGLIDWLRLDENVAVDRREAVTISATSVTLPVNNVSTLSVTNSVLNIQN
jgi:hypothetical protein